MPEKNDEEIKKILKTIQSDVKFIGILMLVEFLISLIGLFW